MSVSSTPQNACILFFVKYPEKGTVKTRLSRELGDDHTIELYRCFVQDMLGMLKKTDYSCRLYITPPDTEQKFRQWLGDEHLYAPQAEGDLGERMERAFQQAFDEGYERVVLIGSDIPDLPPPVIKEALRSLKSNDAVIGPSRDGGYYLIGFNDNSFLPAVFAGIAWSTRTVFEQTMDVLSEAEYNVHRLPK